MTFQYYVKGFTLNGVFTKSARQLARINDVTMINRNALLRLIDLSKLPKEHRQNLDGFCKQLRITNEKLDLVKHFCT